ncbi:MAG TPA: hypothetical protein VIH79_04235, partial [Candidatus Nanopelagicaceae bacterium]
ELAQVRRFSEYVDKVVEKLSTILHSCVTRAELNERVSQTLQYFQAEELAQVRLERFTAISKVPNNPRMARALGAEQERLTEALEDLYRDILARGWGNSQIQPRTAAVIIQALTVGRAVDDFTPTHVNQENWVHVISIIIKDAIFSGN